MEILIDCFQVVNISIKISGTDSSTARRKSSTGCESRQPRENVAAKSPSFPRRRESSCSLLDSRLRGNDEINNRRCS